MVCKLSSIEHFVSYQSHGILKSFKPLWLCLKICCTVKSLLVLKKDNYSAKAGCKGQMVHPWTMIRTPELPGTSDKHVGWQNALIQWHQNQKRECMECNGGPSYHEAKHCKRANGKLPKSLKSNDVFRLFDTELIWVSISSTLPSNKLTLPEKIRNFS